MATKKLDKLSSDEEILDLACERFKTALEAFEEIRKDALDDLKFSAGEQWSEADRRQRQLEGRPCLTINRLPQTIRQVTNDQRQNRPAIKVSPVDDKADVETAKIYQGLIRHIEYASNADTAYDIAFDSAVRCGLGFFRVVTDYCDPMSFDQDIKIKAIPDRFSAVLDPSFQELDGSDANWGFVFEDVAKDVFKKQYPKAAISSENDWESFGEQSQEWVKRDQVRVAEYFVKEYERTTIAQVIALDPQTGQPTKQVIDKKDLAHDFPKEQILDERETLIPKIKWYKLNGVEILETRDWAGKWIPIIPVLGEQLFIEGKRQLVSIVRHAKDAQRMLNFWKSTETETINLAPKAPWIVDYKSIEGFEKFWQSANTKNHAYLPYKSDPTRAAPQRNVFEPPVQAVTQASMLAGDDIKSTTGIYDAALGNKSNENSGVAIQRRNIQSQTSNFHFMDNLAKAIRHCGRICADLIPSIYDTPRAERILGEDGQEEIVRLNEVFQHNGKETLYDMGAGQYDVTVDTGPSFETKRQEAVASMADLSKSFPQLMQVAGDLMVKNMDWNGAQEIAERIKKTLPPGLADDPKNAQAQLPPQVQAQMQQMSQMIQSLTQHLHEKTQLIETKQIELDHKERLAMMQIQAQVAMKEAELGAKGDLTVLAHRMDEITRRLEMNHELNKMQLGHEQASDMQAQQAPQSQPQVGSGYDGTSVSNSEQQPTGGFSPGNNPMGAP